MEIFYSRDSILTIIVIIIFICGIGYYLGSRAINKIPFANSKARLLKALEYAFFMLFIFFILLMKFQGLYFLSAPNEFAKSTTQDIQVYRAIQNLQIAHSSFYYIFLAWTMTSYFLIKVALKEENSIN